MALGDDNVRPVSVRSEVGNGARESDQGLTVENGEADGVLDCPSEYRGCERTAPGGRAKQSEHGGAIEAPTIGGKAKRTTSDLNWRILHDVTVPR